MIKISNELYENVKMADDFLKDGHQYLQRNFANEELERVIQFPPTLMLTDPLILDTVHRFKELMSRMKKRTDFSIIVTNYDDSKFYRFIKKRII